MQNIAGSYESPVVRRNQTHPAETPVEGGLHIFDLPNEILALIFGSVSQSIANIDMTCRRFLWIDAYSSKTPAQLNRKARFDETLTKCALLSQESLLILTGGGAVDPFTLSYGTYALQLDELVKTRMAELSEQDPLLLTLIKNKIVHGTLHACSINALLKQKKYILNASATEKLSLSLIESELLHDSLMEQLEPIKSFKKLHATLCTDGSLKVFERIASLHRLQSLTLLLAPGSINPNIPAHLCILPLTSLSTKGIVPLDLTISQKIGYMKTLRKLCLENCTIESLPEELASLPLKTLKIVNNKAFTALPQWIGLMRTLSVLILKGNRISSIPDTLTNLPLEKLDISDNPIEYISRELWEIKTLQKLSLPKGSFCLDVYDEIELPLEKLVATNCGYLPLLQVNMAHLREIDVSCGCTFYDGQIPSVFALYPLEKLNLSSTGIKEIPPWLGTVKTLKKLYLGANKIHFLPQELSEIPLEELDLNYNALVAGIPQWIGRIKTLEKLHMVETSPAKNSTFFHTIPDELTDLPQLKIADFRFLSQEPDESYPFPLSSKLRHLQKIGVLLIGALGAN